MAGAPLPRRRVSAKDGELSGTPPSSPRSLFGLMKGRMMKQTLYWTLAVPLTAIAALLLLKLMPLAV
jgi:hypothetical protein